MGGRGLGAIAMQCSWLLAFQVQHVLDCHVAGVKAYVTGLDIKPYDTDGFVRHLTADNIIVHLCSLTINDG